MSAGLPPVATLIPQPRSWKDARSLKAISGMTELEKFSLQVSLVQNHIVSIRRDRNPRDSTADVALSERQILGREKRLVSTGQRCTQKAGPRGVSPRR